ncbi:hypothetical protein FPV67DRAFT_1493372 [Lyophyllum atratum]|nr:hypothetical protein FPV67DRAFT_1493372 [Lyophyllum atratum]
MTSTMPWLVLLAFTGRAAAQLPTPHLVARQDPSRPSPNLAFHTVGNLVSCAPTILTWEYTGPDEPLSLLISNTDVPQNGPTTSRNSPTFTDTFINTAAKDNRRSLQLRDSISALIAAGLSPNSNAFNWTVNVPQGNYVVVAVASAPAAYFTRSSPFFVQQGSDTSCLGTSSSSSAPLPSDTSSSSPTTSIATTTSSSATVTPIGGSSSTPVNKGAIAGGVVAGVVILLGALGLYIFFICRPKRSRSHHTRSPSGALAHSPSKSAFGFGGGGGGGGGRWGGLSSVDSHMAMKDTAFTATPKKSKKAYTTKHHSQTSSVGHIVGGVGASQDDIQTYLAGTRSRAGSVAQQYGSPSEEKFGSPEEVGLPTLASNGGRSPKPTPRSYSSSTYASELANAPAKTHRRPSLTANTRSKPHRPSIDSTVDSHQQSPFTPPATSPVGVARSPSTASQAQPPAQRKTPRKPVPAYADSASSSAPTPSPISPSPSFSPFDSPVLPVQGQGQGHYATRAERESLKSTASNSKSKSKARSKSKGRDKDKDREGVKGSEGNSTNASSEEIVGQVQGTLAHKSSFGPGGVEGKQLHYLIPDMPVAQ